MLRIVIDTNIFVSAIILPRSLPAALLYRWLEHDFELVTAPTAINELDDVLSRPRLTKKYLITEADRLAIKNRLLQVAIIVEGDQLIGVVPNDPKDDVFISCAVEGGAKYIVTGDNHLLSLGRYMNVKIVTVAYFLAVLVRCKRNYEH